MLLLQQKRVFMQKNLEKLIKFSLFKEITEQELIKIIGCFRGKLKNYEKEATVIELGEHLSHLYIVVSGEIFIYQQTYENETHLVSIFKEGQALGELFLCSNNKDSHYTFAKAKTSCTILELDYQMVLQSCASACSCHSKFIKNLLEMVSLQAIDSNEKVVILSFRHIRDRLIFYLNLLVSKQGNKIVCLPFSKTKLAEYLCVNRSALMRELSKMEQENLLKIKDKYIMLPPF